MKGEMLLPAQKTELDRIAGEIRYHDEHSRQGLQLAIAHKIAIGDLLATAKALLPHGMYVEWAQAELGWSARHCQRHVQLYEARTRVSALGLKDLSMRAALAAIAGHKPRERWMVVGYLDGEPGDAEASALAAKVKTWKVRKA